MKVEEIMIRSFIQRLRNKFFPKQYPEEEKMNTLFTRLHLASGENSTMEHRAFHAELARSSLAKEPLSLQAMIDEVIKMKQEQSMQKAQ